MQEMRCINTGSNNNNGISSKMSSKIHNIFDKKTIGTASMRQRPTKQAGINQIGINQSANLQNNRPFLSPDNTQLAQYQQSMIGNMSQQNLFSPNNNNHINQSSLSFLAKPGFQLFNLNSQGNSRIGNNSCCANVPNSSLSMNANHSSINLFDTSQIHSHNKKQSIGSSNNLQSQQLQQQQQFTFLQLKNNYFKYPNALQVSSSASSQALINQEKRLSEQQQQQSYTENSGKAIQLTLQSSQQQQQQELNGGNKQSIQLNLIQTLTQKTHSTMNQSSTRANQKMRKTNSMSMIRLRQSQDSFFDTIRNGDSNSNQAFSMLQSKKKQKKKGKKLGLVSPTSSASIAAAALSQLISSQTNRIKSIPSPQPIQTSSSSHYVNKTENYKYKTSSSSQNDFSPQIFPKLKKKKMLFFQPNIKGFSNKGEYQQDFHKLQHNHQSCDNSPSYNLWPEQQQQQEQQQQLYQQVCQQNQNLGILCPEFKNMNSLQQSLQQSNAQSRNILENTSNQNIQSEPESNTTKSSALKKNNATSKTSSLLDKLNKIHKYSQQCNNQKQNQHSNNPINNGKDLIFQNWMKQDTTEDKYKLFKEQRNLNVKDVLDIPREHMMVEDGNHKANKTDILLQFQELLEMSSCKSSNQYNSPLMKSLIKSDYKQQMDKSQNDNVIENEDISPSSAYQQQIICKQFFTAQSLHDIPLPSQALKTQQYLQYEAILQEFKNQQSSNQQGKQFAEYLIDFAKKFIKPIPSIVRNSQQISSQYKKKDEEVKKLKQERLNFIMERNKCAVVEKQMPQFINIQQMQQQNQLKELHTPSTQIEESNSQSGNLSDQQMQIAMLKLKLDEKNNQLANMIHTENITLAYLQHLQKLGFLPTSSSFCSDLSERWYNDKQIRDRNSDSNQNTPHSANPLETNESLNSNPLNMSSHHLNNILSSEKETISTLRGSDNLQWQYQQLYSKLQKIIPSYNNKELLQSENSISMNQLKEQPLIHNQQQSITLNQQQQINQNQQQQINLNQQQKINQQLNQWMKFISKKKNSYFSKGSLKNSQNSGNINSLSQNSCSNITNQNSNQMKNKMYCATQNNINNVDYSCMNLDKSDSHQISNSTARERNSLIKDSYNQLDEKHSTEKVSHILQANKKQEIKIKEFKQGQQAKQVNSSESSLMQQVQSYDDTPHSQVDTALQNKSTQGNLNQISSMSNDADATSQQYLKNTPLISQKDSNQILLEDYKKKNSKLTSVMSSQRNSLTSKSSSYAEEESNKQEIQNQIVSANIELMQRYNQSMIVKSKSSSNLNENIRQKLKLDLSVLKGSQSNTNMNAKTKGIGLQLNTNFLFNDKQELQQQQQINTNTDTDQNQVMDYYDEFMSKIDEFSLSWRKAVIDEGQKYQNRDNPFKKQQLMDQHLQKNIKQE